MLSREAKAEKITRFSEWVAESETVIIAENAGLTAQDMRDFRQQLAAGGARAQVVKNTLAKRVLDGGRFAALSPQLKGPLVYGVGDDPARVAKIFSDLARSNPKFIIRGGALPDKDALDAAGVDALAKLPSREQLLAKLLGTMQAPIGKFVGTLAAVPGQFVRTVAAVRDKAAD